MVYESEIGLLPNMYFHRQLTHPALSKPPTPPYPPSSHRWAVTAGHKNLYNPPEGPRRLCEYLCDQIAPYTTNYSLLLWHL